MPVLLVDSLDAGASTELAACPPISFQRISDAALTVECKYHNDAKAGLRIHVRASCDGINYDTEDLHTFDIPLMAGQKASKTAELDAKVMFVKAIVENMDGAHGVTDVKVTATLGNP